MAQCSGQLIFAVKHDARFALYSRPQFSGCVGGLGAMLPDIVESCKQILL